ncbi:cell division FtsA domain-containing protein [Marasmitruncus massiliensis]|uniref:cell division FtsA domain-containing protein n=1 Tax=Marasmitruncus massiliensis TaxID=1944642 RepID=UPI000C7AEA6B|nr:cell division FtsA domain-containing protein [Marasmitruncus massiliensis]
MEENKVENKGAPEEEQVQTPEPVFALDIGTRSIIGIVGAQEKDLFSVWAVAQEEHTQRSMIDGQIENVDQVAATADIVRKRLEKKLGFPLKNVCVAAAGRALKTQKASFEMELDPKALITRRQVFELEMGAIQQASSDVGTGEQAGEQPLYCVGHSVMRYYLDDYPISTLINHRGRKAKVEIIATFLPTEVVESLYTAMSKIGLSVASITLEPIAAMNAIIPQELRMLNLALVDIGAGTSDIAISDGGCVTAYTMATVAGDEISEAVVKEYLVDFETAEKMKLALSNHVEKISYTDILGFSYTVSPAEIMEKLAPASENLGTVIASKILEVNGKPPAAVFMVGGGSQLPQLCRLVAQKLSIDENKVAIGGNNYMKRMVTGEQEVSGPEYATPMGIAITAMLSQESSSFSVSLNGRKVMLFKGSSATVMDLLIMCGYRQNQIIGRSGKSINYELDGKKMTARGGHPTAAVITVNGQSANISTPLHMNDQVLVAEAVQGADAAPVLSELVPGWKQFYVSLNGSQMFAGAIAFVNGVPADGDRRIGNLDSVQTHRVETLADLCMEAGLKTGQYSFVVNGKAQSDDYRLAPGDEIRYFPLVEVRPVPQQQAALIPEPDDLEQKPAEEQNDRTIRIILNGRSAELVPKEDHTPYLFVDMLNFVDIDPTKPQGDIILRLNGRDASYLEVVHDGDSVDIYWDKTQRKPMDTASGLFR